MSIHAPQYHKRDGLVTVTSLKAYPPYYQWIDALQKRDDVIFADSVLEYVREMETERSFGEKSHYEVLELLEDGDYDELDLPADEPASLWHGLSLLNDQPYGEGGELHLDHQNIFHMNGSAVLIIEGRPRARVWHVSVSSLRMHLELDEGTRLFRRV